jgi:hypothetical protein
MSTTSDLAKVPSPDRKSEQESSSSNNNNNKAVLVAPTSNNNNNDKENSPNAVSPPTTSNSPAAASLKRPTTESIPTNKKVKAAAEEDEGEILDLAVTLGYQPGDRLQVQWEIEHPDAVEPIVKWWGATLQEFDGRSEDNVAIRVLKYDPYPELGFEESSLEDVIFLGDSLLVSPDSTTQLNYKKEGSDEDNIVWLTEDDMDQQLNAILMGALAKNEAAWKSLPPSQQAAIAERIKIKKEELLKVLRSKKEVITSSSIKEILRETFGGAT